MSSKATPGPWHKDGDFLMAGDHICIAEFQYDSRYPYSEKGDQEAEANHKLATAAPELLAELKSSVMCIETARQAILEAGGRRTYGAIDQHLKRCAALIAEAEGA